MQIALSESIQKKIIEIIRTHIPHCTIYIFGSRAIGRQGPGSDIDLAIEADEEIQHSTYLAILADLYATTIPMEFDLIDLKNVSQDLKNKIITQGKVLWKT